MKYRRYSALAALILLLTLLAIPAQASQYRFIFDEAVLLTTSKTAQLEEAAADVSDRYDCGVYIVTLWDYTEYGNDVRDAAENYFLVHNLGCGNDDDGVLLMLSMAERDYALIAHGNLGNKAFTDYGKEMLSEEFLDDFRYDDWAGGFDDYISGSEEFLYAASFGEPVDTIIRSNGNVGVTLVMILLIPAAIAGIVCGIMVASMKTAARKTHADEYRQGVHLTARHDRFLTRTVVRQKIETSSTSSSGGSRVNSGGFSGRSGKF